MLVKRYRHRPELELYNVKEDPYELRNLAGQSEYRDIRERLYDRIKGWMKRQGD